MKASLPPVHLRESSLQSDEGRLEKRSAGQDNPQKLREAARDFEAIFLRQVFGEMSKTSRVFGQESFGGEMFQGMFEEAVADVASERGGIGLARLLERAWGLDEGAESTTPRSLGAPSNRRALTGPTSRRDASSASELPDVLRTWQKPVDGQLSSGFGARIHPITHQADFHAGLDFAAPVGTPIRAVAAGRVVFAGERGSFGNLIEVEHPGGWTTRYAHADRIEVESGAWVSPETVIGTVGQTGRATGPHLHFEVRRGATTFDPSALWSAP